MKIKIVKLGEGARELELASGASVDDAMGAIGGAVSGHSILVNGVNAPGWRVLVDGDVLTMSPKVEAGC